MAPRNYMPINQNQNRRMQGTPGSITTPSGVMITFPSLPMPNNAPITINTPAANYPQVISDPAKQKPIVVVPEIIYPHKVKRMVIHHNQSVQNYYRSMFGQSNPYYQQFAANNPYWTGNQDGFKSMQKSLNRMYRIN